MGPKNQELQLVMLGLMEHSGIVQSQLWSHERERCSTSSLDGRVEANHVAGHVL